jgi:exosome complex component CSL4
MKKQIFIPGEVITTEEEYSPGQNTFADDGYVKAATAGEAKFDDINKEVSIPGREIKVLEEGDIIFGRVTLMKESVVVVDILRAEENRILLVNRGQIPVRNVAKKYVSDLSSFFKVGDYIKARVVSANDLAVDLTTAETGLGVITAYCSLCKSEMKYSNGKVICFNCGHSEERKWFEEEDKTEPRSGNDRGRRDFRGNDRRNFGGKSNFRSRDGNRNKDFGNKDDRKNNFRNNSRRNDFNKKNFRGN